MSPKMCHICGEMLDACPHGRPGLPPEHDGSIARCKRCHKNPAQFCTSCVAEVQAAPLQGINPEAVPQMVGALEAAIGRLRAYGNHSPVHFGGEQGLEDILRAAIAAAKPSCPRCNDTGEVYAPDTCPGCSVEGRGHSCPDCSDRRVQAVADGHVVTGS